MDHRAVELFPDGIHVRLRSRVNGTYLHADEDGVGVSLRPRGRYPTHNGVWRVHRIQRDGLDYVLLHGAAYGRYLALSADEPAPPGCIGSRAVQRGFDDPEQDAVMWKPTVVPGSGGGGRVFLRHLFNGNLRANGRFRLWNTDLVSIDYYYGNTSTMRHWMVEVVPPRVGPPPLPPPTQNLGLHRVLFWWRSTPEGDRRRVIRYLRSDEPLNFGQDDLRSFTFYGRSVFNLRTEAGIYANQGNVLITIMCVQAGLYGRLTPVVTDLPHSDEPMHIVVFTAGAPDAEALVYPDVDAQ